MEFWSSLGEAFWTVLSATLVFVAGQIIEKMFISPIQEQRKVLGKILHALTFYANKIPFRDKEGQITNLEDLKLVSNELRDLSANVRATSYSIPFYKFFSETPAVPKKADIEEISRSLIGWHNSIYDEDSSHRNKFRETIQRILKVTVD